MPNKKPKLSILVPIYNVEKYLPLCLETIENQTMKDFECLLINDGSTDSSLKIIKNIAKKDKRFIVIDKKNSGYGASLNLGIKKAKGKYIGIVEPDDFVNTKFFETLLKHDDDIVKSSFMMFFGKTWKSVPERVFHALRKDFPVNGLKVRPKENQKIFLADPTIWSAIYKKEMLEKNGITFLETPGASYQDVGFQFKTFASAKTIYCIEEPLYYYRKDNDSSSVKSDKKIDAVKIESDSIDEFVKDKEEFKLVADICRFRNYNWNLNRLKRREALQFAKTAKADYKNKSFDAKIFIKTRQPRCHELTFSTKHPYSYVYLRPIFHFKNFLKSWLRKILIKSK